jgi:Fic family protein
LAQRLADSLFRMPVLTVSDAAEVLGVRYQTAHYNVQKLVDMGILRPLNTESHRKSYISNEILGVVTESGVEGQSD